MIYIRDISDQVSTAAEEFDKLCFEYGLEIDEDVR